MRRLISRRHMLRGAAVGASGVAGLAALAACGETQVVTVEKIVEREVPVERVVEKEVPVERVVERVVQKEVPVDRIVEKVVTREVMVEAMPAARTVKVEHATDHTSGPRGAAMSWAIERFALQRPDIKVKFIPQDHIYYEKIAVEAVAGTLSESNLLNGVSFQQFAGAGIWLNIDDIVAKKDGTRRTTGSSRTSTRTKSQVYPYDSTRLQGPLYGLPYQGAIGGLAYNVRRQAPTSHPRACATATCWRK